MAIVQISRIQHRRGLQQDLPQLASAELGWSIDTRQLFIGNGTLEEGAPSTGVSEILTEHSDFFSFINAYTFKGTEAGYTSQTGPTTLSPIARSLQNRLDDAISLRDFGTAGNGVTDDTAAIQRAIDQIYVSGLNATVPSLRRTIKFPAGTYKITSTLLIPPGITIVGDGKNNTIITSAVGTIFSTVDSKYQSAAGLGTNSATLPQYVNISGLKLSTAASTVNPVVLIDSGTNIVFNGVSFVGDSSITRLVNLQASATTNTNIIFNNCTFDGGANGIGATGAVRGLKVSGCSFANNSSAGIAVGSFITGLSSEGNYFGSVATPISGLTGNNYSVGDSFASLDNGGLYSGAAKIGSGRTLTLSATTNTITTLSNGDGIIDYQITDGTNYRIGTFKYAKSSSTLLFDDEYSESSTDFLSANLFANSSGSLTCYVNTSATLKYNIKQFV